MKTIKQIFFGSVILLFSTTSCLNEINIRGNGNLASEERAVKNFEKVNSSGSFDIHISNGDQFEVVVDAEENILPYIETYLSGNTLNIETKGIHNIKNQLPIEVFVTMPNLTGVKQSGSGTIICDYFEPENFEVRISGSGYILSAVNSNNVSAKISGSGKLEITGETNHANISISGSGKIAGENLIANSCNAQISGSGDLHIFATESLNAGISGSGNIYYLGTPSIETHISGSGKVIQLN